MLINAMLKNGFLLLITFFLVANHASAQSYELEGVIHNQKPTMNESAPLMSGDSKQIDNDSLNQSSSSSVDDVLRLSPVATTARGPRSSGESPQVRGLDMGKIFVEIDGVPQKFQEGHRSMIAVDTDNLKSVQLFTSGGENLKSSSIGGGVNFVTKDVDDILKRGKESGSEFKTQYNSANQQKTIKARTLFRNKILQGYVGLGGASAEKLNLSDGSSLDNSSFEDATADFKLEYQRYKLSYSYFRRQDDSPIDPSLNPPGRFDSLLGQSEITKNTINLDYKANNDLYTKLYLNQHQTIKERQDSGKERKVRRMRSAGVRVDKKLKKYLAGATVDYDRLDSESNIEKEIKSFPSAQALNTSVYLESKYQVSDFSIEPGLKGSFSNLSADDSAFKDRNELSLNKKLGIIYKATSELTTFAKYTEGHNTPKLVEVYPSGVHIDYSDDDQLKDNYFIPNPDLKSEQSDEYEVGFNYIKVINEGQLRFDLSYFEKQITDYIVREIEDKVVFEDGDATTQFVNLNKVKLQGSEVKLSYLFNIYDFSLSHTQIRGRNEKENLFLEDLPADTYQLNLKAYLDKYRLEVGYLGMKVLEQTNVNPETIQRTDKTADYLLHNVFIKKSFQNNFDINLRVDNLGNTKYRRHGSHLYESEQDIKIGFKYKINTI